MDDAVVDTNVIVAGAFGSPRAASARVLDAYYDGKFRMVFSPGTIDELLQVLALPSLQARHGWSDDEVIEFVSTLLATALICEGQGKVSAAHRRHLLRLKRYKSTRMLTPAGFLVAIS